MKSSIKRGLLLLLMTALIGGIGHSITDIEAYADDNRTVLAFTSDVHNNENNAGANRLQTWITNEQQAYGNEIDFMGFCGDMGRADSSRITESQYWTYTRSVMDVADTNFPNKVCYTTGNHELEHGKIDTTTDPIKNRFTVDAIAPGAPSNCQIYCMGSRKFQPSWNNNVNEYTDDQVTALQTFLDGCVASKPVFIISHYPLHLYSTRYTTNADKIIDALNAAADQGQTIVFLWGHNHTKSDSTYDEIHKPSDTLEYAPRKTKTIKFIYAAAGCMSDTEYSDGSKSVKGKGLIVEVMPNKAMTFAYYDANGNNVTEGGTQEAPTPAPPYTVSFNANGHGTAPASQTVDSGEKLTRPVDINAHCYTFDGWFKNASCTEAWNFDQDTVTTNQTLFAKWTESGHDWSLEWIYDATDHWHACTNCTEKRDVAQHTWNAGSTVAGVTTFTCTTCGATKTEGSAPSGGGDNPPSGGGSGGSSGSGGDSGGSSGSGGSGGGTIPTPEPQPDPQAENRAAADAVISAITVIPPEVSLENEDIVTAARTAYQQLTAEQKALVPSDISQRLEQAETTISNWKAYRADVAAAKSIETRVSKLKNTKGKKLTVSWKRAAGNTGYLVRYSTDRNLKKGVRTKTVKGAAKTSFTLKNLKKGKTYYVAVCAYTKVVNKVTDSEETICGDWTKVKKVKVKK